MTGYEPQQLAPRITVLDNDGSLSLRQAQLPTELNTDEVLVEMDYSTICTSDLHTIQGRRKQPTPSTLGHEGAGTVVASAHADWQPGDRVTWSVYAACGNCDACTRNNLPQKCERLFKYGHERMRHHSDFAGTLASHILLQPGTNIVQLPDELPSALASIANCAVATIVDAARHLPANTDRVLIQGAGLLGLLLSAYLKDAGVTEVFMSDPDEDRRDRSADFGATPLTGTVTAADAVIELAGTPAVMAEGIQALRPGGTYILAGMVHAQSQFTLLGMDVIRKQLTIQGIHNYGPASLNEAVSFLTRAAGIYPFASLLSETWPLSQVADAANSSGSYRILIDNHA